MTEAPGRSSPARVFLRPLGNPLPLAFLALAAATLLVSGLQLGWFDADERVRVGVLVAAFAVPLQLLAATFGFMARDPVAGTGVGVLGATWLALALAYITTPPGSTSGALGVLLLVAGVALLVPASAAAAVKVVAAAVMLLAAARFALSGMYELTASGTWADIAGITGLALCGASLYAALAFELEDARKRTVLPTLRRGPGRQSLEGDLAEQVKRVNREAGVREQL